MARSYLPTIYQEPKRILLPPGVRGKTVLDIGGYDGGDSAPLISRGCTRPIRVVDIGEWQQYWHRDDATGQWSWGWPKPRHQTDGAFLFYQGDFMEWQEAADIVLFHMVLYHLPDWEAAFPKLRALTKEWLILSTYVSEGTEGWVTFYNDYARGIPDQQVKTAYDPSDLRARPTIPQLFHSLGQAGFRKFPICFMMDDAILLRCG